jgi:hypothetical protein
MMSGVLPFPPVPTPELDAEEQAYGDAERKTRLFAWANKVLKDLGLADKVSQAKTSDELRKITFDEQAVEVTLAIRDALHPTTGSKDDCFVGLNEGALRRILRNRVAELKKDQEKKLDHPAATRGAGPTSNWTDDLILDDDDGIRPLLANLILFLSKHPQWERVLGYDEFNARVVIRKRPPWDEEKPDTHWTDHHESQTRVWFQRQDINAGLDDVGRAVQVAARGKPFHPVREYLDALVWDGTARLDTWLVTYFHAEDSEYIRAIGPRWLISAVVRVYDPGCKVDHLLVLEGPQGKVKTESLRTLAVKESWFSDRLSHMATKDAAIEVSGVWLFEIAEMDALTRSSSSTAKSFLTRRYDRFRPPHSKHPISLPRQCVFAGTINPPVGGYLKDATGARRFWPVACRGVIDREGIERDRDQLWAEAVACFKAGKNWWLQTLELEALATAEQAARFVIDAPGKTPSRNGSALGMTSASGRYSKERSSLPGRTGRRPPRTAWRRS